MKVPEKVLIIYPEAMAPYRNQSVGGATLDYLFCLPSVKYSKLFHGRRQNARSVLHSKPAAISQEKVGINDLESRKGVYGDWGMSKRDCAENSWCFIFTASRTI